MSPEARRARFRAATSVAREAGLLALSLQRDPPAGSAYVSKATAAGLSDRSRWQRRAADQGNGSASSSRDAFLGRKAAAEVGERTWVSDPRSTHRAIRRRLQPFSGLGSRWWLLERDRGRVIYKPALERAVCRRARPGCELQRPDDAGERVTDPARAMIEIGWAGALQAQHRLVPDRLRRVTAAGASMGRSGAGALSLAHVADGRLEAAAEIHINSWDVLAGILMVWEAGGWTNDFPRQ